MKQTRTHSHFLNTVGALLLTLLQLLAGCEPMPDLHLHENGHVEFEMPEVHLDINVLWEYEVGYDWRAEWTYGWDDEDVAALGELGYSEPKTFELNRYYLGPMSHQKHTTVEKFYVNEKFFRTQYHYGYYDMLLWNRQAPDKVSSLDFDESTTLDSVMVFTSASTMSARYQAPLYNHAFNQPDELFAAYERDIHISDNLADYDSYDPATQTYYKKMQMHLAPVTYIYLTQVRLHHNGGKVVGTMGEANLSGMARSVTLNSGVAGREVVSVHYLTRFKEGCTIKETGETVDIAGGRCLTFGIPNQNSTRVTRAEDVNDRVKHYMDVDLMFYNGMDSTLVFDITDQVRKRYRGGVITIDLDMDTIPVPARPGGSAFDAVVKEFDEENFFIEI